MRKSFCWFGLVLMVFIPGVSQAQVSLEELLNPAPQNPTELSFTKISANEVLKKVEIHSLLVPNRRSNGHLAMMMQNLNSSLQNQERLIEIANSLVRILSAIKHDSIAKEKDRLLEDVKTLVVNYFDIDTKLQTSTIGEVSFRQFLTHLAGHLNGHELSQLNKLINLRLPSVAPLAINCRMVFF